MFLRDLTGVSPGTGVTVFEDFSLPEDSSFFDNVGVILLADFSFFAEPTFLFAGDLVFEGVLFENAVPPSLLLRLDNKRMDTDESSTVLSSKIEDCNNCKEYNSAHCTTLMMF